MRFKCFTYAAPIFAALAVPAFAETVTISQAGKAFSEKSVTLKVGDQIEFVNDDENVHNVHSATAGHEFDMGAQNPGSSMTHTFDTPGKVKVRCAIHPKMKMTVEVE